MITRYRVSSLLLLAALAAPPTGAAPVLFSGSSGSRSAQAGFQASGPNLLVTLTNTSSFDALVNEDILTGIFFQLSGVSGLQPVSALLDPGSYIIDCGNGCVPPIAGNVGGEWAFRTGLSLRGASFGISSAGLGLFGPADRFPGPNLQGPESPAGDEYGLVSTLDDPSTGANGYRKNAKIVSTVAFILSGLPNGFDPSTAISAVSFQYGSSLADANLPGTPFLGLPPPDPAHTPEPATIALMGVGLLGLALLRRRRIRS